MLSQTGPIGALLLLGALGAAGFAALRARLRGPPLTRVATAAAAPVPLYWLVHGSVDWFWELPGARSRGLRDAGPGRGRGAPLRTSQRPARAPTPARVALGIALRRGGARARPPVAGRARYAAGRENWQENPRRRFRRLDRAKTLDPARLAALSLRGCDRHAARSHRCPPRPHSRRRSSAIRGTGTRRWSSARSPRCGATRRRDPAPGAGCRLFPRDLTTRDTLRRVRAGRRLSTYAGSTPGWRQKHANWWIPADPL